MGFLSGFSGSRFSGWFFYVGFLRAGFFGGRFGERGVGIKMFHLFPTVKIYSTTVFLIGGLCANPCDIHRQRIDGPVFFRVVIIDGEIDAGEAIVFWMSSVILAKLISLWRIRDRKALVYYALSAAEGRTGRTSWGKAVFGKAKRIAWRRD